MDNSVQCLRNNIIFFQILYKAYDLTCFYYLVMFHQIRISEITK